MEIAGYFLSIEEKRGPAVCGPVAPSWPLMVSGTGLVAFFGLTAIHVSAAVLYKYSQSDGKYEYSPATTLVLAEVFKIFLSLFLHCTATWSGEGDGSLVTRVARSVKNSLVLAMRSIDGRIVGQLCGLALSYALYNQCQFLFFLWADAANVVLLRSSGSFVAAVMAYYLLNRDINRAQWLNILLQVCGLVMVQYDACTSRTTLAGVLYVLLFLHVSLSSFNSIWNEHLVKATDAPPLNVQNAVLYSFGTLFNLLAYFLLPNWLYGVSSQSQGFFHGYTFITILIVALNSVIGLAITAVYKYADVLIKTFSLACATGTLFLFNWAVFGKSIGINVILGIITVYGASYLYFLSASERPSLPAPSTSPGPSTSNSGDKPKNLLKSPIISSARAKQPKHKTLKAKKNTINCLCICMPEILWKSERGPLFYMVVIGILFCLFTYISLTWKNISPNYDASDEFGPPAAHGTPLSALIRALAKSESAPSKKPPQPQVSQTNGPKQRLFDPKSRLDRFSAVMSAHRALRHTQDKTLAVCFLGAPTSSKTRQARWNLELDFFSDSSFDTFLVQPRAQDSDFSLLGTPTASSTIRLPDLSMFKADTPIGSFCTLRDWLTTALLVEGCVDLVHDYATKMAVSYQWLWIAEPQVTWQGTLPELSSLEPAKLYTRDPSSKADDISSLLGTTAQLSAFSSSIMTGVQVQYLNASRPTVNSSVLELAELVATAAKENGLEFRTASFFPLRDKNIDCISMS